MEQRSARLVAVNVSDSKLRGLILSGSGARANVGRCFKKGRKVRNSPSRIKQVKE